MSDSNFPSLEIDAFEKCIKKFLKRHEKRLLRKYGALCSQHEVNCDRALSITRHATHILHTLYIKRSSLENGIHAFSHQCDESMSHIKKMMVDMSSPNDIWKNLQKILQCFFTSYLQLRDGFVLLTSGECRHKGDVKMAKNQRQFKSRLSTVKKRGDGYTKEFKSELGYSGSGWDEFYNEEVGVRRRLLDMLRLCCRNTQMSDVMYEQFKNSSDSSEAREKIWNKLIESGAEIFENSFDSHNNETKDLQQRLEEIRSNFLQATEKMLAFKGHVDIFMVKEDKFERLELTSNFLGVSKFEIKREGNDFSGIDDRGALPNNSSINDWKRNFKLPDFGSKNSSKKRKRIIDDSSSGEDEEHDLNKVSMNKSKSETAGKGIKMKTKKLSASVTKKEESIHEIKRKHGVDHEALQKKREVLEAEEEGTKLTAYQDEVREILPAEVATMDIYTEELSDHLEEIRAKEEEVLEYKSAAKRTKSPDIESWIIKETLRQGLVELGNLYIDFSNLFPQYPQRQILLSRAEKYFRDALHIIYDQIQINETISGGRNSEGYKQRKRSSLLCRSRAFTNIGITYYDQSEVLLMKIKSIQMSSKQKEYVSLLRKTILNLNRAKKDALSLRAQNIICENDNIELERLELSSHLSLLHRYLGYVYFKSSNEREAITYLDKSSGASENGLLNTVFTSTNEEKMISETHLLLDYYQGSRSLIAAISSIFDQSLREIDDAWDRTLVEKLDSAFTHTRNLCNILSNLRSKYPNSEVDKIVAKHKIDCSSAKIYKSERDHIMARLKLRFSNEHDKNILTRKVQDMDRNELLRNNSIMNPALSTERIIIDDTLRKNIPAVEVSRKQNDVLSTEIFDPNTSNMEENSFESSDDIFGDQILGANVNYIKWGDEIFKESGIDINVYPSCEPPRPLEMLHDLQQMPIP